MQINKKGFIGTIIWIIILFLIISAGVFFFIVKDKGVEEGSEEEKTVGSNDQENIQDSNQLIDVEDLNQDINNQPFDSSNR